MQRSPGSLTHTCRPLNSAGTQARQVRAQRLIPRLILVAWLAVLTLGPAFLSSTQAAAPCKVPSTAYPTIQAAVNDVTCATIHVAAGTYVELVTIACDVTLRGAGEDSTALDGGVAARSSGSSVARSRSWA
jgi:hypothetical protein